MSTFLDEFRKPSNKSPSFKPKPTGAQQSPSVPALKLSGSPTNKYGLKDFSGTHKGSTQEPMIAQYRTVTAFESAMEKFKASESYKKMPEGWEPTIKTTYKNEKDGTNNGEFSTYKPSSGRIVSLDMSGYSTEQVGHIDNYMKEAGFKRGSQVSKANGVWAWEIATDPSEEAKERTIVAKDVSKIEDRERAIKSFKKDPTGRYGAFSEDNHVLSIMTEDASPTTFWSDPVGKSSETQKQLVEAAKSLTPIVQYKVAPAPSDKMNLEQVNKDLKAYKMSETQNKLTKNVYVDSHPLGFEDKVDMPAQIRMYTDPAVEKTPEILDWDRSNVGFIDCFILKSMQARLEERYFIFQSLGGDSVAFFFGDKPVVYNFSGVLMDTYNQQWYNDFLFYYEKYLRGSQSIRNRTKVMMVYEDQIIEGFILDMNLSKSSEMHVLANFSFNMLMTDRAHIEGYRSPTERTSTKPSAAGSYLLSTIEHTTNLLNSIAGTIATAGQDTWKPKSSSVFGFPIDMTEANSKIKDNISNTPDTIPEESMGAADLRNDIRRAAPGTSMGSAILVRDKKDLSIKERSAILNTPGASVLPHSWA